jgi:hypothetical protein
MERIPYGRTTSTTDSLKPEWTDNARSLPEKLAVLCGACLHVIEVKINQMYSKAAIDALGVCR